MTNPYFEILRPGINTTIQDDGRNYLYHIGITVSGAMDQRNYKLANKIANNQVNTAAIEFAYQGPLLKLKNGNINFAIIIFQPLAQLEKLRMIYWISIITAHGNIFVHSYKFNKVLYVNFMQVSSFKSFVEPCPVTQWAL